MLDSLGSTMASRLLCVTDTNIWIDLEVAGLSDLIFKLPLALIAPDLILAELGPVEGELLVRRGLQERELTGAQVLEVARLAARYLRPSRVDLFALVLARSESAVLLTGDRHLRQVAEQEGVEVHGTLWVIDQMVSNALLSQRDAAQRLRRMKQAGRRLPAEETDQRIRRWEDQ